MSRPAPPRAFPEPPRGADVMAITVPPQHPRPGTVRRVSSPRVAALGESPDAAAVAEFWSEVEATGTPLIEAVSAGECTYTFVYRGSPGTRRVACFASKLVGPDEVERALFARVPGTDIWWWSVRLGDGWRSSYAIAAQGDRPGTVSPAIADVIETRRMRSVAAALPEHRASTELWFDLQHFADTDPLARESARPGGSLRSVASGPQAPRGAGTSGVGSRRLGGARTGRLVAEDDAAHAEMWWHIPDGPAPDEWEVLVLLDGERWIGSATLLDEWHETRVLPPTVTLLVGAGDLAHRVDTLTCSPEFVRMLVETLEARADDLGLFGAPLTRDPARTRIAGQSLGGLTALYAQCLVPARFGISVSQSGSFWWPNAASGEPEAEWVTRAIAESGIRLGTVVLEVGLQEWVMLEPTRRLREALADRCDRLITRTFDGGHDEACWNASLPGLLQATSGAEQ